ncbi:MAG: hypothetical protein FJ154_10715, partial [Gammaproteobacteria bacterium]|nr:hypothetical protein [Gammaproteobacteria bacterium]
MLSTIFRGVGIVALLFLGGCASLTEPYFPTPPPRPVLAPAKPAPPAPAVRAERKPPAPPAGSTADADVAAPAPSKLIRLPPADIPAEQLSWTSEAPRTDLMDRIRVGFKLPDVERSAIDVQLAWYERNPEYLDR